jgi:hypothetical protein
MRRKATLPNKRKAYGRVVSAYQPYSPTGFAPILTTGPAVCSGPGCAGVARDNPGTLVIFPKTLQRRTVGRRYPKRRPGR